MIKQDNLFATEGLTKSNRSLHTPSSFAKKNLLYVQEVGRLQSLKPHKCIREKLDSFLFLIVLEGKGNLEINGRQYNLSKGNCAFIDCMEHYEHISDEKEAWKLAWVHFNGSGARAYYDIFYKNNNGNVFHEDSVDSWNEIIGKLLDAQVEKDFITELKSGEMLLHLLNKIVENVSDASVIADEAEKKVASDIREILNERYAQKDVLESLTDILSNEPKTLNSIFNRFYGITIEEYMNNRRMVAAKEMLRFTVKPVEEVATETGIGDVSLLQEMFHESEGVTAEEYRMKWAQWIR